jgi:5-formyltetrahydrofolate cyclo-ligase
VRSTTVTGGGIAVLHDDVAQKQAMRARIRGERRYRPEPERLAAAEALARVVLELPEVSVARCVACYASLPGEPGTAPLREALRSAGIAVLLPIVLEDGHLEWALDEGDLVATDRFGGPEPTGPRLGLEGIGRAQVVIVPALAVDTLGNRLGQGAGYYDRTLRLIHPSVPVYALLHDSEVLDAAIEPVPAQAHDLPVDAAITPHRCLRLPPRRRR